MVASADGGSSDVEIIAMWKLPDCFFELDLPDQWKKLEEVTFKATKTTGLRKPCKISLYDEFLAAGFLLVSLGVIWVLSVAVIVAGLIGSSSCKWLALLWVCLALHPLPRVSLAGRSSRLSLALCRYFTFEVIVDRKDPLLRSFGKSEMDKLAKSSLPCVALACPHGVFNYGAIIWCCLSRWICGWYQFTGAAKIVGWLPGLRYLDLMCWLINSDRKSIKGVMQDLSADVDACGANRRGGMLGMVPDGIQGAFRSKPGHDELVIGRKRGLMRICLEEGATVYAAWFFGTTDMLTVVKDPWGIMEYVSRRLQSGIIGYYGRWYLPLPFRTPVSLCVRPQKATKTASPTEEQVEQFHQAVYGGLLEVYNEQKHFAGYSDRNLVIS
eukprot:TRINITY_DN5856_c0_g1_i1.p1 TRINITY_DN5856_c0_g1~~TRINITY_DN5856_c0_g1_i1.p1  ORF type:complete len:383 (+),score=35.37 TRINITY_DN5856_c0_g1_i1:76-1224(+)